MALGKSTRIALIIIAIPVVLLLVAIIGAKFYFTNERLRTMVVPQLEKATNREVTLSDISLSVFPSIAVSMESLSIANPRGASFDSPAFVQLDNLDVSVKLFPLINGNIEVDKLTLDRPRIYLEVTKDGIKNSRLSEASKKLDSASTTETETGSSRQLLVSDFEINDGFIESVNKKFDSRYTIDGLDASASINSRDDGALVIDGDATIEKLSYGDLASWLISDQPVATQALQLSYNLNNDILSFDKVGATVRALPLTVGGTISQLKQETLMMDLSVTAPGATMDQLLSLIPPDMLKTAKGLESSGDVKFALTMKGPSSETMNPATHGEFSVSNGRIQYSGLPKAITGVNLSGTFDQPSAPIERKDLGTFAIDKFSATLGNNTLTGNLRASNFQNPTINASFNGSMNLAEVRDYYPLEEGSEMGGLMKANVSLDGKAKMPQSIKANGGVEFQDVTIKTKDSKQPIRNLNGSIAFNNQVVESKKLAMNIGESDLDMAFTLRNYLGMVLKDSTADRSVKPSAALTLRSKQFRTQDVMPDEEEKPAEDKKKSSQPADQQGMLSAIDLDANVTIDKLVTEKFTFNNANGSLAMSNGIMNLKNFSVNAFNGSIQTKGMLDMSKQDERPFKLDLDIKEVESSALLSNFTSFGQYLFGKLNMTTSLAGDLNDTLGLERQSLLGTGIVQVLDGELRGLPILNKLDGVTGLQQFADGVDFKDWKNAFSIENGKLNVKNLTVNAGQTGFVANGAYGLDGMLDYALTVKLPESLSGRLKLPGAASSPLNYMKDKDGRINLTFRVTGTADDPTLKLDTDAQQEMAKQALEQKKQQVVDEGKKKIEEELKKKAAEGLKNILKRP